MTTHYGLFRSARYALLALAFSATAHAATTDISSVPLNTYSAPSSTDVKPNILFILDNSGSMSWDYMPDTVNNWSNAYGQYASQCNGVYYNPTITYTPPVDSSGTSYATASFTAAWKDGYSTSLGSYNLSSNFDGMGVAAYYYQYTGTQTTAKLKNYYNSSSTFYKECGSAIGSTPGSGVFTKVTVSSTSGPGNTDERTNFANWYSYYRTRMLTMKTASGLAFKDIDSRFRVGFMTINSDSTTDFLNIADFSTATKSTWYTALYGGKGSSSTPLRTALSNAGRLYTGQVSTIHGVTVTDPVQYSCQQNYAILSTDGFWNQGLGYKLDGSAEIGNEDSALARPYFDGGSTSIQQRTSTLQQQAVTLQAQTRASTLQTRTSTSTSAPSIQTRTSSDSGAHWTAWQDAASCNEDDSGTNRRDCQFPKSTSSDHGATWSAWFYASSCNTDSSGTNQTMCSGSVTAWSAWSNAASCTASSTTQCQYTSWSSWSNVASCTAVPQSTSPNYTVATAVDCQNVIASSGPWTNTSSCTVSSTNNCQYTSWSSWATVSSCTPVAQSAGPTYTVGAAVDCQTLTSGGSTDSLADVAAYYYNTDLRDSLLSNCTGPIIAPATTANDLCANNVPSNGRDVASTQHMTTFTVGLGVRGRMVYSPTYWNDTSGDFWDVWKGTTANSSAGICSWQTGGTCNWPTPGSGAIENVDDLWHASVNGHGTYFNATDPASLTSGLTSLLTTIINTPRPGTAAAAASSNPNISSSDNYVFSSSYKSVEWFGELIRQQIDASTGTLSAEQWSAMTLLDTKVQTDTSTRKVYTNVSGALTPFLWANLTGTQQAYFKAPYLTYASVTSGLSQFCPSGGNCLSSTAQSNITAATGGAAGENLINFLRGDRSNEATFYRVRTHVLGDIVSSEARYVKTATSNMVYVAANDGMLHAFNALTGDETWAYIPSFVLPSLYKLADANYSLQHQFLVDGSPEVGDIVVGGSSKTILVGGLKAGGKGFYAMDITNPASPSLLWEFTDTNMGYSYGNPRITKLGGADAGTWVVILTSGYNNADGKGHLYVLNANTGALIRDISTGVGSAASPSGLARISAQVVSATDNTVKAVYGGDLLGNLWRFDVNGNIGAAGYDAQLLVSLKDASGNAQPITAKPTVATIDGNPVVYIGTGIFLGTSDITSTTQQSFYAIKDKLDATTYGNPRTVSNNFVAQTLTNTTCPTDAPSTICTPGQTVRGISSSSCQAMNWVTKNGWYVDFLTGGERSTTDSGLGLGTLIFTTITPNQASASACGSSSGTDTSASFAYAMDYQTGCSVSGSSGVAGVSLGSGLATKGILGRLADGTVIEIIRTSGGSGGSGTDMGNTVLLNPPVSSPGGTTRRVSWRELITE
ncbi:MAG: PilC/PilY family type IV pilus protein [Sterolibacterium sp.]